MARYVERHLIRGEKIVYQAKLHWIIFLSWCSLLTLGLSPLIRRLTGEFVITNKRIVMKTGLIKRNSLEMNLSRVESVEVDQSVWGRILGYGDITIIGTGGTRERFPDLADPLNFRTTFQQLI